MGSIGTSDTGSGPGLPIVDFTSWFFPQNESDKMAVARKLVDGCRSSGSVYITGHGVSEDLQSEVLAMALRFFSLDDAEKNLTSMPADQKLPPPRGWTKIGGENVTNYSYDGREAMEKAQAVEEKRECYDIGSVEDEAIANIWPSEEVVPGFKDTMTQLHAGAGRIIRAVLAALGLGLELEDADFLLKLNPPSGEHIRLLHSPAIPTAHLLEGKFKRMGLHKDFSTMALIFQDDCGGLQMANPYTNDGVFVDATPIPGTCVLTIGQPIEIWTNGFLKANPHRVAPPSHANEEVEREAITKARFSVPYFANPEYDTVIKPCSEYVNDDRPAQFEPITTLNLYKNGYRSMASVYD